MSEPKPEGIAHGRRTGEIPGPNRSAITPSDRDRRPQCRNQPRCQLSEAIPDPPETIHLGSTGKRPAPTNLHRRQAVGPPRKLFFLRLSSLYRLLPCTGFFLVEASSLQASSFLYRLLPSCTGFFLLVQASSLFYCILVDARQNLFPRNYLRFRPFWHLRTAPTSKRRPETAESWKKRGSHVSAENGLFQGLKFPETIRFHSAIAQMT